jgi:hypothetical protein
MGRRKPGLDERERKFVEGIGEGKSMARSAREAGYASSTAAKKAYAMVERPLIKSALTESLMRQVGSMDRILRPIVEGLDANLVVPMKVGPIKTDLPDYRTRLDSAALAIRMLGGIPKQQELPEPPPPDLVITVNVEPPMQANGLTVSDQRDEKLNLHISVAE